MDALLTRLYERYQERYLRWGYAGIWLMTMAVAGTTAVFIAAHFEGLSFAQFWIALGWTELTMFLCVFWARVSQREQHALIGRANGTTEDESASEAIFAASLAAPASARSPRCGGSSS